jgi:thymidine kinase
MAKLYFYYASMNAGKSTALLQADFNYRERGMATMLFTAAVDDRFEAGTIASRIGLTAAATMFDPGTDIAHAVLARNEVLAISCVLVDEAQFLSAAQVDQLARLADAHDIPVLAYGLRTDFRGQLFEGAARLLALADALVEIKSVCTCGRKATMNLRVDAEGHAVREGMQTEIGGNDRYLALCRRHFTEAMEGRRPGAAPSPRLTDDPDPPVSFPSALE